jgi:hypothetical protein
LISHTTADETSCSGVTPRQQLANSRRRRPARDAPVAVGEDGLDLVLVDDDALDLAALDSFGELVEVVRFGLGLRRAELDHQGRHDQEQNEQDGGVPSSRGIHHTLLGIARNLHRRRATHGLYPSGSNICLRVM